MRMLIYGANGWIGGQFYDLVKKNTNYSECVYKGLTRLDNITELICEIEKINPTHVFCFIGRTHGKIDNTIYSTIDYLEQPGKWVENVRDNLYSPVVLAKICDSKNIHLTYLGTGCIFTYDNNEHIFGDENMGFEESSAPNFFGSGYSIVKGYTDQFMNLFPNVLNLRIRMPITTEPNSRNFITKITKYDRICSIPNSMTVLTELLPHVIDLASRHISGTLNLTNPGLISHNEILEMYREIVDPDFTWENMTVQEQREILAADRSNNCLDTKKLQLLCPNVKNIKESVRDVLHEYKKFIYEDDQIINTQLLPLKNNTHFENSSNTTLLVTGGCGFIGSNFINIMMEKMEFINVINIDALYYCADEMNVNAEIRNSHRYKLLKGNICSMYLMSFVFEKYKPTHVIHFAAQSHVQNSFTDALQYTNDNIVGTHTILEAMRLYGSHVKKFIHVSTDEVYGESNIDSHETSKTEQSILCPTNPYAATKGAAELLAQSYYHSFKLPIIITRGNNVYGPNQYNEKVIPRFISQLNDNKPVTIQGDGSCLRSFLHVKDTAYAFLCILEKGSIGEIYNIGCDEGMEYSVLDVAKILIKRIKNTEEYDKWIEYVTDRPFNDKRYYISNDKLKKLGWDITISFSDGIKDLLERN